MSEPDEVETASSQPYAVILGRGIVALVRNARLFPEYLATEISRMSNFVEWREAHPDRDDVRPCARTRARFAMLVRVHYEALFEIARRMDLFDGDSVIEAMNRVYGWPLPKGAQIIGVSYDLWQAMERKRAQVPWGCARLGLELAFAAAFAASKVTRWSAESLVGAVCVGELEAIDRLIYSRRFG